MLHGLSIPRYIAHIWLGWWANCANCHEPIEWDRKAKQFVHVAGFATPAARPCVNHSGYATLNVRD